MKIEYVVVIIIIFFLCLMSGAVLYTTQQDIEYKTSNTINSNYCNALYNLLGVDKNYDFSYDNFVHNDFKCSPHYVKIHILPEKEGTNVSVKMDNECFKNVQELIGRTDNNSEVTFPMISSARYNILIDDNRCSYYIYPVGAYYNISCGDVK